jgi:aspartate-semialdehyde dehydrogenase
MVGSVLLDRMREERDFEHFTPHFFSTSQVGEPGPDVGSGSLPLGDAASVDALAEMDAIVSCQGGDYTREVHPKLRAVGYRGYWIDAASALRMSDDAVIALDPLNRSQIDEAIEGGTRDFAGGNCTVSLMLMAVGELLKAGWVEWIHAATYQAASGAGARNMRELVQQMRQLGLAPGDAVDDEKTAIIELDRRVQEALVAPEFPQEAFGAPLGASLLPWIDSLVDGGRTREEWKGHAECNKLLGLDPPVPIDGLCVRVGTMRCHSQALTLKLNRDIPLEEIEERIRLGNDWVEIVPNEREATLSDLTPAAVSGSLRIPVGRLHKLRMGPDFLSVFTVGDQLLWGAAEPLRRTLRILIDQGAL